MLSSARPATTIDAENNALSARIWSFVGLAVIISVVADGWAGKPSPWLHQLLLLPASLIFLVLASFLLARRPSSSFKPVFASHYDDKRACQINWIGVAFEGAAVAMLFAESAHFRRFGYHLSPTTRCLLIAAIGLLASTAASQRSAAQGMAVVLAYLTGTLVSIASFPLNYLRSDMLPVIGWADERLWRHLNPYATMHVGTRVYDFPYLPGVLIAFLPATALGIDLRYIDLVCTLLLVGIIYFASRPSQRSNTGAALALFLLSPFLQYRHDLYLQPHWLAVTAAVVLLSMGELGWSAFIFGVSAGIYQLSWVLLPFVVLYAFRVRGLTGALRAALLMVFGCLILVGPFLPYAIHQVANNTVGQWSHLPHALADPMNLSFWLTYLIRPDQLRYVQASVLTILFLYSCLAGRCASVEDTLRCMAWALTMFIPLNVLVDGYFYLTLLLVFLLYLCVASGWWKVRDLARVSSPRAV